MLPSSPQPRPSVEQATRLRRLLPWSLLIALLMPLGSCSHWWFSGVPQLDRSRPVALIETTGGIELGATTELGILTLGRSAKNGPCRVHYFLGPTPLIEDGKMVTTGSVFTVAEIDLQTQSLRVLDRTPRPDESLLVMWTPNGVSTQSLPVQLANDPDVAGDVLADPGVDLPAGASIFMQDDHGMRFVGLVSGVATLERPAGDRRYYTFSGVNRLREMLAVPEIYPYDYRTIFRPDDIIISKPIK